jgi:hypothetical protein
VGSAGENILRSSYLRPDASDLRPVLTRPPTTDACCAFAQSHIGGSYKAMPCS